MIPPEPLAVRIRKLAERAAAGTLPSGAEVAAMTAHIAQVGFSQTTTIAGGRLARLMWQGGLIQGTTVLPNNVAHYLRHCVVGGEWAAGTTLTGYLVSLQDIIIDPATKVFVSQFQTQWQIGFVNEARQWRGPQGNRWVLVEYRCSIDGWVTAFQPRAGLSYLIHPNRNYRTWLRR